MYSIEEIEARARMIRAEAFADTIVGIARVVFAAPRKAFAATRRWAAHRRAYEELMSLDDRQLRDMGLARSEIPAMIAGSFMPDSYRADVAPVAGETANANEQARADVRRVA